MACCRKFFGAIHPRIQTPHYATVITGIAAATFGGLLPIGFLGELVSIGTLVAFIVVCFGVLVLRYTRPDLKRPFRVAGIWFTAPMGVLFCATMAYSLPNGTWWRLLRGACWASRSISCTATSTAACGGPRPQAINRRRASAQRPSPIGPRGRPRRPIAAMDRR